MLTYRDDNKNGTVEDIMEVLQPPPSYESGLFYGQLLSTVGPKMTLPLISRLRKVSDKDSFLVSQIISGITSLESSDLPEQANALLADESPRIQRSAMRLLADAPTAKALDGLWALHVAAENDSTPFLSNHEHGSAVYKDSFRALAACLRQDPSWIKRAIRAANPESEPVHDLAYLLAGLEGGEQLWKTCKSDLFSKVSPEKERSLARCIYRYRDEDEKDWLTTRINRENGLVGAMCVLALAVIEPAMAVQHIGQLPASSRYMTRGWAIRELLLRSPHDVKASLLDIIRSAPDPWRESLVYQGFENDMDCDTLDLLLDETCSLLRQVVDSPPKDGKHPLWIPLSMLSAIHDVKLLQCFERRKDSCFETLLTTWMLSRGPRLGIGVDHEVQEGLAVLYRIGGRGFIEVVNDHLQGESRYGRLDGIGESAKRYDGQTMKLLEKIIAEDALWDDKLPLEQDRAARALAIHEDWRIVADATKKWGVKTSRDLAHAVYEARRDGKLTALFNAEAELLREEGSLSSGDIFLLGLLGVETAATRIQLVLADAEPTSEMAVACVLALGYLGHGDEKTVSLLVQQLAHHRFAAVNALLRINNPSALQALMAHVREHQDIEYLLPLLSQEEHQQDTIRLLQDLLREYRGFDLRMTLPLITSGTDEMVLTAVFADPSLQERIREEAFLDEGSSWVRGSKDAAIRCLATFDRPMAFLAAEASLRNENAHDRPHYPSLLMDIDRIKAVEVIIEQAGTEEYSEVCRSLGRALSQVDAMERLEQCARDGDANGT
ncbi:MAG: HEAT repeat domain-containing protein [Phycisphaerae bacterium]|nr:HEAT repeat domain-containing protein [Phycisphaerae bacterium]